MRQQALAFCQSGLSRCARLSGAEFATARISGSDKVSPRLREFLLDAVALAALGLVADVVPLHDENRIYVRAGLARLREKPPIGMKALIESADIAAPKAWPDLRCNRILES